MPLVSDPPAFESEILEDLRGRFGMPCFTWRLGSPGGTGDGYGYGDGDEPLDCNSDRVGGRTGFAQYPEQVDTWPCDETMRFVCQVDLGKLPAKMKMIVGDSGLLQIFQSSSDETGAAWYEGTYVRVIPQSSFGTLVPCAATPRAARDDAGRDPDDDARTLAPTPIVGWDEHVDLPCEGDEIAEECWKDVICRRYGCMGDDYDWCRYIPSEAHLWRHKFGGYGSYTQEGSGGSECPHCGGDHLAQIQFQLVDDYSVPEGHPDKEVLSDLKFGDNGSVQWKWCPKNIADTSSFGGACY